MCPRSSAGATRTAPPNTLARRNVQASVAAWVAALALFSACTSVRSPVPTADRAGRAPVSPDQSPLLNHQPLDPSEVTTSPGPRTAEENWFLDLYTFLHSKDFTPLRVELPPAEPGGDTAVAHLVLPHQPDRPEETEKGGQPVVIVLPILGGDHFVSEAFAKALVNRGIATARLERRPLNLRTADGPEQVQESFAEAVRDARRLLDWLESRPEIDPERIGVAGISVGSLMACLLHANDRRISASVLALSGGGLSELLYESHEPDVRRFRRRMVKKHNLDSFDTFRAWVEPYVEGVDPSQFAGALDPDSVLLVSGRFDHVIAPARSHELWTALGQPEWVKLPTGHYSAIPFIWYVAGRAVKHFDRRFSEPTPSVE